MVYTILTGFYCGRVFILFNLICTHMDQLSSHMPLLPHSADSWLVIFYHQASSRSYRAKHQNLSRPPTPQKSDSGGEKSKKRIDNSECEWRALIPRCSYGQRCLLNVMVVLAEWSSEHIQLSIITECQLCSCFLLWPFYNAKSVPFNQMVSSSSMLNTCESLELNTPGSSGQNESY